MKQLLAFLFAFFLASSASAQFDVAADVAAGGGFMFAGDEDSVFSADSLYAGFHWNGLQLPGPSVSSGVGIEFHPATVNVAGDTVTADYRIWSLNRTDCPAALYCGVDLKIGEGGDGGWTADFDQRIVLGVRVARIASAVLNLEVYSLEDDRPISAFFAVRWGGENQ